MEPLFIMALVLFEVALWQWRVALTVRGGLLGGAALGLVGAVVQITAISRVVDDMGDVAKVAGYACGVAGGVVVGCLIDRRFSVRHVSVRVFAPPEDDLVAALTARGWPVTATEGFGPHGRVDVVYLAIDQRGIGALEKELAVLAPAARWTIERIAATRGLVPITSA